MKKNGTLKRRSDYQGIDRICLFCKRHYNETKKRRLIFCSIECFGRYKQKVFTCNFCGINYTTSPTRNTKYCSRACLFKGMIGKKRNEQQCLNISLGKLGGRLPSGGKKLRHLAKWNSCRLKTLSRDGFMCQICYGSGIEVHHIKPIRSHPSLVFEESNLITLCKDCHLKTYNKEKEWEEFFLKARRSIVG